MYHIHRHYLDYLSSVRQGSKVPGTGPTRAAYTWTPPRAQSLTEKFTWRGRSALTLAVGSGNPGEVGPDRGRTRTLSSTYLDCTYRP